MFELNFSRCLSFEEDKGSTPLGNFKICTCTLFLRANVCKNGAVPNSLEPKILDFFHGSWSITTYEKIMENKHFYY